ncbi:hypothetical protein ACFVGY_35420 [Streptomyces sp. NPDC127106]|uniref:hypothetical protein n=1 Tax=Streptomyces sp. NPDC127106 TaxID=3345360 RepID=UPI00362A99E9
MTSRTDQPDPRLRVPGDTLSADTLARAEMGLNRFVRQWQAREQAVRPDRTSDAKERR